MNLYEITTGAVGESYVRCYVWAPSEGRARELFLLDKTPSPHRASIAMVTCLFSSTDGEFVTRLSDSGWEP